MFADLNGDGKTQAPYISFCALTDGSKVERTISTLTKLLAPLFFISTLEWEMKSNSRKPTVARRSPVGSHLGISSDSPTLVSPHMQMQADDRAHYMQTSMAKTITSLSATTLVLSQSGSTVAPRPMGGAGTAHMKSHPVLFHPEAEASMFSSRTSTAMVDPTTSPRTARAASMLI